MVRLPLHLKLRSKVENGSLVDRFSTRENDRSRVHNPFLWRSAKPVGYWTVRRGCRFGYVASMGFPITNHPFEALRLLRAGLSLFTFHLSPIPHPLTNHQSLLTSHGRASGLGAIPGSLPCILSRPRSWPICVSTGPTRVAPLSSAAQQLSDYFHVVKQDLFAAMYSI